MLVLVADALVRDAGAPRGDDRVYELMAEHPFATHTYPFAYRFLVPTLVHVLPFGHTFSFSVLAWLSSAMLVACCLVSFLFAGDWGRVMLLAAPVVYVAAGHVLAVRPRAALATVAAFAALDLTYAVYMQLHGVESGIVNGPLAPYPVL